MNDTAILATTSSGPGWRRLPRDPSLPPLSLYSSLATGPFAPPREVIERIVQYALQESYRGTYGMIPILARLSRADRESVRNSMMGLPVRILGLELAMFSSLMSGRNFEPADVDIQRRLKIDPRAYAHITDETAKVAQVKRELKLGLMSCALKQGELYGDLRPWSLLASPLSALEILLPADFPNVRALDPHGGEPVDMVNALVKFLEEATYHALGMVDVRRLTFALQSPTGSIPQRLTLSFNGLPGDTRDGPRTLTCVAGSIGIQAIRDAISARYTNSDWETFSIHLCEAQLSIPPANYMLDLGLYHNMRPFPYRRITVTFPVMRRRPTLSPQGITNPVMQQRAMYLQNFLHAIRNQARGDILVEAVGIYAWWKGPEDDAVQLADAKDVQSAGNGVPVRDVRTDRRRFRLVDHSERVKKHLRKLGRITFVTSEYRTLDAAVSSLTTGTDTAPLPYLVPQPIPTTPPQVYLCLRSVKAQSACHLCRTYLASEDLHAPLSIASEGEDVDLGAGEHEGIPIWKLA